ncbi:hypothetical protein [Clostridium cellulovorans]|uniref:Lj928 prophage protein n=1 Tax=Clostridium cellulovorans (strain ATCC 35296 / DSM 3052 / OCM 3 / 743B) TaxID=573061 RepID=D9SWD6_CLOC7|nr:hypothetical protein [Clostridium cellulovorans]ADL53218.1 Lj928 prophage protein [Clostridium cellulovorans 743B]
MGNNFSAYVTLFQQALDKQAVAKLTSGWMDANAGQVIYNGGKDIKIPKISMDGLADYNRSTGFTQGAVTLDYETKTMTMDRGRTFLLDSMDVNETNFVVSASNVMGQFQATKVVPEIDAYRYSTIATSCIDATTSTQVLATGGNTITAANVLELLKADIAAIQDIVGGDVPLVISMSAIISSYLDQSDKINKNISIMDFEKGGITTKVKSIDMIPIIPVPSARLKTKYVFNDGVTSGQTAGGFVADATAKNINWLITPQTAPIAVNKTDKVRIFDPATNQDADAWKLDYRKYHDLWIMDEALKLCRVNIKEALV